MPTCTTHEHGAFSWLELATTDAPAAKKFYAGQFGWTFDDRAAGPDMVYTMCKLGNRHAAALYKDISGAPPHWTSYITVDDVDATTKKVRANGGTVLKDPFDVMDVGRMAVVSDPTGATFCLWTAKKHIGAEVVDEAGAQCWNELLTTDPDRAAKFYTQTFGWTTQAVNMGPAGTYTLFKGGRSAKDRGGMMALRADMRGVPPHWLAYFGVADADASAARTTELGGKVCMPPTDIPNVGRFAVVQDPQGATFAFIKGATS